ncbi:ABATE domain-containing protein [Pseudarthrobacter sp. N5]|uniref:ABATE domain-containing protein n=1 Tax=Pseudarthrobacter sp. N5 TaxID=3418416 RepID=UPI003CEDFEEA
MSSTRFTPDVPPPAPGEDEHASLQLANSSVQMPNGRIEMLNSPAVATSWLIEHGLAPQETELQEHCSGLLISMRRHIRDLFEAAAFGRPPETSAVEAVNEALTRTPSARLLGWDPVSGFRDQPTHPTSRIVEHALAAVAGDAVVLLTGPEAELLAACGAEQCNRYMIRTHARRHWCSKRCGDRVRAARSYALRKERLAKVG